MALAIAFAAAALLAAGEPVVTAPAVSVLQSRLAQAQRKVCYTVATAAIDLDVAERLNFAAAPEPLFRAEVCNFLRETGQLEDFKFTSHAECAPSSLGR